MPFPHGDTLGMVFGFLSTFNSDNGLAHLAGLPLEHFVMHFCFAITDHGLLHLANLRLKHIEFVMCHQLTGESLKYFNHAECIDLRGSIRIKETAIIAMSCLSLLRILCLKACLEIGEDAVARLRSSNPELVIIR